MSDSLFMKASFIHSPIGHIPKGYPRLDALCKAAWIQYHDEKIRSREPDGAPEIYRVWAVVADNKPAVDARGNRAGLGSANHEKFCMLLDLVAHENPVWTRTMILDCAVTLQNPTHKNLMKKSWREMNDELAKMGMDGYDVMKIRKSKSKADMDLPQFD